jgi:hypothetical protein
VWSLRYHSRNGGFYITPPTGSLPYYAYHIPGFPAAPGFGTDEISVMSMVREYAILYATEKNPYYKSAPFPRPQIIVKSDGITWLGSAGAESYQVEKQDSQQGPFTILKESVIDNVGSGATLFSGGGPGYYRVIARNKFGNSGYSDVIKVL